MNTYTILLGKKNGLFKIKLGEVNVKDKRAAKKIGERWCDEMERPQWKKKIIAVKA